MIGADLVRLALARADQGRAREVTARVTELAERNPGIGSLAGAALARRGLPGQARPLLDRATEIYERLGAAWWPKACRIRRSATGCTSRTGRCRRTSPTSSPSSASPPAPSSPPKPPGRKRPYGGGGQRPGCWPAPPGQEAREPGAGSPKTRLRAMSSTGAGSPLRMASRRESLPVR